jgi:hypothetical protein
MYVIRVDESRTLLRVECSGDLATTECVRAVSQAFALAEAGNIWALQVELDAVEHCPSGSDIVGTALAAGHREGTRVAIIASGESRPFARRVARQSGLRDAVRVVDDEDEARRWLSIAREPVTHSAGSRPILMERPAVRADKSPAA